MIARRPASLLVAIAALLGGLAGGGGAAVHAAATTALALGAIAVAARVAPSVSVPPAAEVPTSEHAAPAHLVPDLLLAGYARRRARDVHTRLRPQLRRVAADLLTARHGLSLDDPRHGDAIEDIVGPEAWDLIRPGRPAPSAGRTAGLDRRSLEAVLAGLERL